MLDQGMGLGFCDIITPAERAALKTLCNTAANGLGMARTTPEPCGGDSVAVPQCAKPTTPTQDRSSRLKRPSRVRKGSMIGRGTLALESCSEASRRRDSIQKIAQFWRINLEEAAELCANVQESASRRSSMRDRRSTASRRGSIRAGKAAPAPPEPRSRRSSSILNIARRWRITEEEAAELALTFECQQGETMDDNQLDVISNNSDDDEFFDDENCRPSGGEHEVWGSAAPLFEPLSIDVYNSPSAQLRTSV